MSRVAIRARGVAYGDGVGGPATLLVDRGVIEAVIPGDQPTGDRPVIGDGTEIVAAGLIDIHTHGAAGVQAIDGDEAGLARLAAFYARHGVTGFLGTVGGRHDDIEAGLSGLADLIDAGPAVGGAACLGIHLEGPFISPQRPGAFRPESIVPPDLELFAHYADLARGHLKLLTLAPELPGASDVIRAARERGIVCSAGHSGASEAETVAAIGLGVTSLTHMFNAMPPLHHRVPGIVGVGLTHRGLTTELIADGVHVHPAVVRLLTVVKGSVGVALVTDSVGAAGMPDGSYRFEGLDILVADGQARLADGTLAGSTLTLDAAVENLSRFAGIPWFEALTSASLVPARLLGIDGKKGLVASGYDADLVGFDSAHAVRWTMVGGRLVYSRDHG